MPNYRVFYATQAIAVKKTGAPQGSGCLPLSGSGINPPIGSSDELWEIPRGIQSVGVSTNFNMEQVYQLGQLALYENVEDRPDIEVSVSRIIDATHPLYLMASESVVGSGWVNPSTPAYNEQTLSARNAHYQVDIALMSYADTQSHASGAAVSKMLASGMYLSSLTYNFPVDGNATEEITFVGNDKYWSVADGGTAPSDIFPSGVGNLITTDEDAEDPLMVPYPGTTRREDVLLSGDTILPAEVSALQDANAIQSISISADLGREEIFAIGSKGAYYRVISYPLEVTCSFECITSVGDLVEALSSVDKNVQNRTIVIATRQGLKIDLGTKNKLTSIDRSGGDTGGGNVSVSFNYSNFNVCTVSHKYYP